MIELSMLVLKNLNDEFGGYMNKSKFLATLLSGGVVLSTMAGFGGMVLADDEVIDTTAPVITAVNFATRSAKGVTISFNTSDEAGIESATAMVYKTTAGSETAQVTTIQGTKYQAAFELDESGEEYTVILSSTDTHGNTTVKKYAYDPEFVF